MIVNVGKIDKVVRIIVGIVLLSLLYFLEKPLGYLVLIGLVPLITALVGFCPLYKIFGLSTCPLDKA